MNMFCNILRNQYLRKKLLKLYSTHSSNKVSILHLLQNKTVGDAVQIQGWIKSLRKMKQNIFCDVSDGSCDQKLQVLLAPSFKPEDLTTGASVVISGSLKATPKGGMELHAENMEVCGSCVVSEGYPFAPRKTYAPEYIRQYLHLRPRTNTFSALLRVRSSAQAALADYLLKDGYINIHTPVLTSNDCEGAGEVFKVSPESKDILQAMVKESVSLDDAYFDKRVFLTVSGQMHLEVAVHGLSKVYTFGPAFRAENSRSRLHLSEFYMLEAETAFLDNIEDLTTFVEALIKNATELLQNKHADDIARCGDDQETYFGWLHKKFPILSYEEAVAIITKNEGKFNAKFKEEDGFSKEHELFLVDHCGGTPTFVINWPKYMKPFYMKECTNDASKVAAFDLLAPKVGELVGGSLRESDYDKLSAKIPPNKNLDWYLELRKYGNVPTGGFGMGFERYLQFILGINNIKDTIPFPRWPHNCNL